MKKSIDEIIKSVNATMSLEGMPLTREDKDRLRKIHNGESTFEHERNILLKKYMEKTKITFECGTIFGPFDSVDWELDYGVTQEEYDRLVKAYKKNIFFAICEDVKDIYKKVYNAAVDQATADLLQYSYDIVEEYIDKDDPDSWRADHVYTITVNFPREWYEIFFEDE